jgi:hypothetical protein
MIITVTQEDIDCGEPRSSNRCAIARAVSRETGQDCLVSPCGIRVGDYWSNMLPITEEARYFITHFDVGRPGIKPFSFELDYTPVISPTLEDMDLPSFKPQKKHESTYSHVGSF